MTKKTILLFIGAIVLFIVAILSLGESFLTPYVSIDIAKKQPGVYVQVIGKFDPATLLEKKGPAALFTITDKTKATMKVHYNGIMPKNYDRAEQVVLLGSFDINKDRFTAEKILVKCPSKYKRKTQ